MVYSWKNVKRTSNDFISSIKNDIEEVHGVYTPQLGTDLNKHHVSNKIYMSNSYILEADSNRLSNIEKVTLIKQWNEFNNGHKFNPFAR
ncbi:MAG: hypothetical protein Q9M91_01340 [Candidatus Dojkabacteria bacterium]|nr:hypothetical protein [Candidatus Dojkabacteria bacterium]MDQ7020468.1 hypothetical protein [Candidatus Dojkabacteria bacterium]